jgi:hypothetical protein
VIEILCVTTPWPNHALELTAARNMFTLSDDYISFAGFDAGSRRP